MRVLLLSKACVVGTYQRKLEEIAARGVELLAIVPDSWRDERGELRLERTHTEGYELRSVPIRWNGNFHLHYYPTLAHHIRTFQPDLVHIDEEPYNFATWHALQAAKRANAKTIFFSWQNLYRRYPPPVSWMEAHVLQHTDAGICGNQASLAVWRKKGCSKPLFVIPQFGVDPQIFPFQPSHPTDRPFTIGYLGRFVPEKGADLLVQAVANLPNRAQVRLELVGSGPQQAQLQQWVAELGLAEQTRFVAWMPSTQLPSYLPSLSVLVLPSISRPNWIEQFGRVLVEAMACGVPVVGSTCGEIPNVIGSAGLVFPEGDVPALTGLLSQLQESPALRESLAQAGRERMLAHFTQAQIAQKTVEVYRSVF
ncbi:MAG TPA: glycosyltransferase family 4 protein [Anaerolineales bacterium]|nr:glycosyltransferase family 4 protein [Anaerolineales bacterium]